MQFFHSQISFENVMLKPFDRHVLRAIYFFWVMLNRTSVQFYVVEYIQYYFIPYLIHKVVYTWYYYIPYAINTLVQTQYDYILYFIVRLIFLIQGFHSEHNCLIYHNILLCIEQDTKTRTRVHILFITVGSNNSTFSLSL